MSGSLKMARLDYFSFKSQMAVYGSLALMLIMFFAMESSFITYSITASWFAVLFSMNIFFIQEKNGLERLYASLSINLKTMISGRYIFTYLNYVLSMAISILMGTIDLTLQNRTVDFAEIALGICFSFFIFTMMTGVQIPIYFQSGYTKGKVWNVMLFVPLAVIVIFFSLTDASSGIIAELIKHQGMLAVMCFLISLAVLPVSYQLSVRCYRKRR